MNYTAVRNMIRPLLAFGFSILCATAQQAPPALPVPPAPPPAVDSGVRVAVLGYHDFSETKPETAMRMHTSRFRAQMDAIRQSGATVITMEDFLAWKHQGKSIPKNSVLITLDDGWRSVYSDAYPILREFRFPFTLFLYKEYIDGGGKALSSDMIREMLQNGASLGSHSVSHPYPKVVKTQQKKGPQSFDAFLRKEMGASKIFIESKFPVKIASYAYPGGFHTPEMVPLADEFGYQALFTVIPGKVTPSSNDKELPRYMILGNAPRLFDTAISFREAVPNLASTGAAAAVPVPYPVRPESGAIVNSRTPVISADLTKLADFDPASLEMRVSGFGRVPATFDAATKTLSWQTSRTLRQKVCQVTVTWNDPAGKPVDRPLTWAFQIDRAAAYLPENRPQPAPAAEPAPPGV